jgi:hypothetical protein
MINIRRGCLGRKRKKDNAKFVLLGNNNKYLKSLREILPNDCYETQGSRPVKVFCDDWNEYICKYFKGKGAATSLFNEYLAAAFLKLWKLNVPDYAIVKVQKHHLEQVKFPFHYFDVPCFGSLYSRNFIELDKIFLEIQLKPEFIDELVKQYLKIGLFDIWLSNEDRNFANMNLLFDIENNDFVPIDHVQIFNGNNIDKQPVQITEDESILTAPFMSKNFSRTLQQNSEHLRLTFTNDFKRDLNLCHENLDKILQQAPPEWFIDPHVYKSRLNYYFSEEWQEKSLSNFCTYIQYALNR